MRAVTLLLLIAACAHSQSGAPPPTPPNSLAPLPASTPPSPTPPPTPSPPPPPYVPPPQAKGPAFQTGYASWYGAALAGHHTASGERFDPDGLTAAHRTLKLGTWVEVRRRDNGRWVRVKVNDRGPVSHRFVIDLSHGAAAILGMVRMGVAPVEIRLVPGP